MSPTCDAMLTIGRSTRSMEGFVALLQRHGVSAVVDVRAAPRSRFNLRFNPRFNREPLAQALGGRGIAYLLRSLSCWGHHR